MKNVLRLTTAIVTLSGAAFYSSAALAEEDEGLNARDIIVTAERRSQSVQDIPIAIQVLSAEALSQRGVTDVRDLAKVAPAVRITEIGMSPSVQIRGMGTAVANILNDPSASFNVDNAAVARPLAMNASMYDLERVEVLKGPQGTLYGRNATTGAINVLSKKPTHEYEGSMALRVGNYDLIQAEAAANIPVGDTLAIRFSGQSARHDGYLTNGANDQDQLAGRVRVLWEPMDGLSFLLTGNWAKIRGMGPGDVKMTFAGTYLNSDNSWRLDTNTGCSVTGFGPLPPTYCDGLAVSDGTLPAEGQYQRLNNQNYTLEMNWDVGPATITVIPYYNKSTYHAVTYNGAFRQQYGPTSDEQTSLEARVASNGEGPLKWIVGAFYIKDKQLQASQYHSSATRKSVQYLPITTTSYAAFGQLTYSVTDSLRLTGGIRYTKDKKDSDENCSASVLVTATVPFTLAACEALPNAIIGSSHPRWSYTSYKAGFEFDITNDVMLYANWSDAYKAGGTNVGLPEDVTGDTSFPGTPAWKPEHLIAWTGGLKSQFFDRAVTLNLEAWHWKLKNYQYFGLGCINVDPALGSTCFGASNAAIAIVTRNAGDIKNYGVEGSMDWHISNDDFLSAQLVYTHGRFASNARNPLTGVFIGEIPTSRTPTWTGAVSYSHTFHLGEGTDLTFSARDQWASKSVINYSPLVKEKGFHNAAANVDLALDSGLTFGLWIDNIFKDDHSVFSGLTPGGFWGHPTNPRTWGARMSAKF